MNADLVNLLEEIQDAGRRNDAMPERRLSYLNLHPETAALVATLTRAMGARSILEIGTSNGYSTIWLASAVKDLGGKVTSIDRLAEKHSEAMSNLRRAGLEGVVELKCGDAAQIISILQGPFDVVFFDADRISAPEQLKELLPKLSSRALILADNALSHPEEIARYLVAVGKLPDFEHVIIPIGKGLSVAVRNK